MRSRVRITDDSYECTQGCSLAADSRTDRFFRLEVLDTAFGGEVLH